MDSQAPPYTWQDHWLKISQGLLNGVFSIVMLVRCSWLGWAVISDVIADIINTKQRLQLFRLYIWGVTKTPLTHSLEIFNEEEWLWKSFKLNLKFSTKSEFLSHCLGLDAFVTEYEFVWQMFTFVFGCPGINQHISLVLACQEINDNWLIKMNGDLHVSQSCCKAWTSFFSYVPSNSLLFNQLSKRSKWRSETHYVDIK